MSLDFVDLLAARRSTELTSRALTRKRGAKKRTSNQKAVAYLRTSTSEQDLGLEAQRAQIEAWASKQGVSIVEWFEEHISGAAPLEDRPLLWQAVETAIEKRVALFIVAKRDRLARDSMIVELMTRALERDGISVRTADGAGDDRSAEGQLLRTILDGIAQYERALIRARTKAALAAKKRKGERGPGRLPYGFQLAADGVHLEENPAEQKVITRMRRQHAEGRSMTEIVEGLNSEGVPARGSRWHTTTIWRIINR